MSMEPDTGAGATLKGQFNKLWPGRTWDLLFMSHKVVILPAHLEGDGHVLIEGEEMQDLPNALNRPSKSMLEAYFDLVAERPALMQNLTYQDTPKHFILDKERRQWKDGRVTKKPLGRFSTLSQVLIILNGMPCICCWEM